MKREIAVVEDWVREVTKNDLILKHYLRTREYITILDREADKEMQIAALVHDIERCFPGVKEQERDEIDSNVYLLTHGRRSAKIAEIHLQEMGLNLDYGRLLKMIEFHEIGGNYETDLLKDADSLSFLDILPEFIIGIWDREKAKEKIDYMYGRITTRTALKLAKDLYKRIHY